MSTDDRLSEAPPPPPASSPARDFPTPPRASDSPTVEWFGRLELSGKLLLFGGLAGVIAAYFPLISVSEEPRGLGFSLLVIVIDNSILNVAIPTIGRRLHGPAAWCGRS